MDRNLIPEHISIYLTFFQNYPCCPIQLPVKLREKEKYLLNFEQKLKETIMQNVPTSP